MGELEQILHALEEVCAGRSRIDSQLVDALVQRRSRREQSGLENLTDREGDVLREIAQEEKLFVSTYPEDLDPASLATAANIDPAKSTYRNAISDLSTWDLFDVRKEGRARFIRLSCELAEAAGIIAT